MEGNLVLKPEAEAGWETRLEELHHFRKGSEKTTTITSLGEKGDGAELKARKA